MPYESAGAAEVAAKVSVSDGGGRGSGQARITADGTGSDEKGMVIRIRSVCVRSSARPN